MDAPMTKFRCEGGSTLCKLPQSLAETLRPIGVRNVDDLAMLDEECPEQLDPLEMEITRLDKLRLNKAIKTYQSLQS